MQLPTFLLILIQSTLCLSSCMPEPNRTFHLVRRRQRSTQEFVTLENVGSLQECLQLAERSRGMAVNYSKQRANTPNLFQSNQEAARGFDFPRRSNRRHYLDQPEEYFNCHVLQCPECSDFATMVNDSRFDYFSLYASPPAPTDSVCVPEVGIFQVNLEAEDYETAGGLCSNMAPGSLAHVVSERRTTALSRVLRRALRRSDAVGQAFVGLNWSGGRFQTKQNEDLTCFLYRAWSPGHPKIGQTSADSNCVALTTEEMWITVDCARKLPFICEIFTSGVEDEYESSMLSI